MAPLATGRRLTWFLLGLAASIFWGRPAVGWEPPADGRPPLSLAQLREARQRAAQHPRRIIFNNDGDDCLYYPRDRKVTPEGLLALRTTALAGSQVDTLDYCTISSGFSYFTHRTQAGSVLRPIRPESLVPGMRNIAQELIDQGKDCLQVMVRQRGGRRWSVSGRCG